MRGLQPRVAQLCSFCRKPLRRQAQASAQAASTAAAPAEVSFQDACLRACIVSAQAASAAAARAVVTLQSARLHASYLAVLKRHVSALQQHVQWWPWDACRHAFAHTSLHKLKCRMQQITGSQRSGANSSVQASSEPLNTNPPRGVHCFSTRSSMLCCSHAYAIGLSAELSD